MNLDYSPVLDEDGQPAGVIAIVIETTDRVLPNAAIGPNSSACNACLPKRPPLWPWSAVPSIASPWSTRNTAN
jgi:hypothetical protein